MIKLIEVFGWLRIPFTYGAACRRQRRHEEEEGQKGRRREGEKDQEGRTREGEEEGQEGRRREGEEGQKGRRRSDAGSTVRTTSYNGQVSAIQLFIVMVVVSGSRLLSSTTSDSIDGSQTRLILIVYMTLGLLVIVGAYRKRKHFLFVAAGTGSSGTPRELERDDATVAGIVTFYVLGSLHDFMHIADSFSCSDSWYLCRNSYIFTRDMINIAYHAVRVTYLACQTLLCMSFNHAYFLDRSLTRHGLMILQAVNVSLWFYEVIHAFISDFFGNIQPVDSRANQFAMECLPSNVSNYSFDFGACLSRNDTSYYYMRTYGGPILRPFNIEYALLVGKCLARWFITCRPESENSLDALRLTTRQRRRVGKETQRNAGMDDETTRRHQSETRAEQRKNVDRLTEASTQQVRTSRSSIPAASRSLTVVLMMISIIANLLLLIFVFAPLVFHGLSINFKRMRAAAACYSCFYYSLKIVTIVLGVHITRHFRVLKNVPFGGLDYLLLFTSSGNIAFDLVRIISILGSTKRDLFVSETARVFYTGYIFLQPLETTLQVSFSLYAGRLRIISGGWKPILFRAIVLFLALCNLSKWIIQTFAVSKTSRPLVTDCFGPNGWPFVSNVLTPLFLFFRFNSFLLFIRIYRRLRRRYP